MIKNKKKYKFVLILIFERAVPYYPLLLVGLAFSYSLVDQIIVVIAFRF